MAAARLADAWSAARRTFSGARAQASRIGESLRSDRANAEPYMTQAGAKPGNEPTMEDILASIRRIIAEDYSHQAALQAQSQPQPQPQHAYYAPQPQPQPVQYASAQQAQRPVMPQASSDILDLNSRGERFQPPMPEVVPVPPPQTVAPQMPRATAPNLQSQSQQVQMAPPAMPQSTQGFAARAVSEFSERLGRSFAAAERYQRENQAASPATEPPAAREPISQSAVQAVAQAVQSHIAEAQALQNGNAALAIEPARAPEPAKAEIAKPELTRTVTRPVTMTEAASAPHAETPPAQRPVLSSKPVQDTPRTAAQQTSAPAVQPQRPSEPVLQNDPPPAWLLSPKTGASISGSFKALQEKQAAASSPLTEVQSAALQELVAAALRPMLKDWLDAHLPGMVERMITAEIQRVTRGE